MKRFRAPALVLVLFIASCGASDIIRGFRVGFAASKPSIQSLVPGTISQAKADVVVRDVDASISAAERAETCIKGAVERTAKARCYLILATDIRQILSRHNIGGSPLLDQIASIAQAAIAAFEEYYRSVVPQGGQESAVSESVAKDAEKKLETKMKDLNKQLEALSRN